ncbi:MAG: right-handed parallel beta-helix repeat-containing protein, partial [Thermodesulfobacteriota bacterium]
MYQSDVPVVSSDISYGSSFGIYTYNASPLIEGNTISNNGSHGIYHLYGSSPVDRNNTITGNSHGIYVQYATPVIDGNTITGNTNYGIYYVDARDAAEITNNTITGNNKPVRLPFSSLPGVSAGNILSPNTKNQIEFWGNTLSRSLVLPADPVNIYYQAGGTATVATGVKLTVAPGVIWKLTNNAVLDVNGALYAVGSASQKIVFTSWRDDSFGGDTNGDGSSAGQAGDWGRISFSDSVTDSQTRLEHVVVRYGGAGNAGSVYMVQADVPVVSSDISYGSSFGIYTYSASPLIEGNTISNNGSYGIYHYGDGSPVYRGNTITGNDQGIYVSYATPVIEGNTITG